jgi:hypothetical protein
VRVQGLTLAGKWHSAFDHCRNTTFPVNRGQAPDVSLRTDMQVRNNRMILGRPAIIRSDQWDGEEVPRVLLSGNHREIRAWRERASREGKAPLALRLSIHERRR